MGIRLLLDFLKSDSTALVMIQFKIIPMIQLIVFSRYTLIWSFTQIAKHTIHWGQVSSGGMSEDTHSNKVCFIMRIYSENDIIIEKIGQIMGL